MPKKTVQQLDAYIKATAVVYDHSNTKLINRKTKVKPRKKQAFLSVLHYRKSTSGDQCTKRRPSKRWIGRQSSCKPKSRSDTKDVKQTLRVFVRTPLLHTPKTLGFQLHPETTVSFLKEEIDKKIGVEARYQQLYTRKDFQLCDLLTLEENGVCKDEVISLRLSIDDQNEDNVPTDKVNLDEKYLQDLSSNIESSWIELAKHLGYEEAEIADIQTTNKGNTEASRHMLLTWWEKSTDLDEAAQKLRRAMEAIGLTELAQDVPATSESRDEAVGPELERPPDADKDEKSKPNEEDQLKKDVSDLEKPYLICSRHVTQKLHVFVRCHLAHKPQTLCLQLNPETSVSTLKQIIHEKLEVQPQQQRLYIRRGFRNFELCNLLTLHDCGIHQDENISLRLSTDGLLGGGLKGSKQTDKKKKKTESSEEQRQKQQGAEGTDQNVQETKTMQSTKGPGLKGSTHQKPGHVQVDATPSNLSETQEREKGTASSEQRQKQQGAEGTDPNIQTKETMQSSKDPGLKGSTHQKPGHGQVGATPSNPSEIQETVVRDVTSQDQHLMPDPSSVQDIVPAGRHQLETSALSHAVLARGPAQLVSVGSLSISGENSPAFLGPVNQPIFNQPIFNLNVRSFNVTETSSEFPQLPIETEVTRNGTTNDYLTGMFWLVTKALHQAKGTDYTRVLFSDILNSCDGELEQVKSGSVTFVVRIKSREGLNKLWSLYTTGDLAKKLTEILITDELTTEDKSDLAIQATILESDYEQACRFFNKLEKDQKKDEEDSSGMTDLQLTQHGESSTAKTVYSSVAAEHAADKCKDKLKTLYMTTGRYSQIVKWLDGDTKKVLMPKLTLVKADDQIENRVISYEDMFIAKSREGNPINLAILKGPDDEQKSILLESIAYDWATGSNPTLSNFKLVTALQMEAIEQESDLIDSIYAQLLGQDTDTDRGDLESFIETNPQKVLVLWDGFDKSISNLDENKVNLILKFLNRMAAKGIRVLVTTRHSHKFLSSSMIQEPVTHVTASEVTEVEIEAHLKEINSEEPGLAEDLIDIIKSSGVLSDWAKSLMMIPLLCSLSKQLPQPDTISRLYSRAIKYIFTLQTDMSQEEISDVLIALGKTALEGLLSPQKRFRFQGEEFEKGALEKALDAGLLICQGTGQNYLVQFAHKTFQDFCAALYCQLISEKSFNEFHEILDKIDTLGEFDYMLRFCCGDNDQCTKIILQRCHQNIDDGQTLQLALKCYFESQSLHQLSTDFMGAFFAGRVLFISGFDNDSLVSLVWFLKHTAEQTALGRHDYLADVLTLTANTCDMSKLSVDMASCLRRMTNLSVLELIDCSLTSTALKDIVSSLRNMEHLRQLDFSFNGNLTGSAHLWASYLNSMDHVEELVMWDCGFIGVDFKYLAASVGSMMHLKKCTFGGNGEFRLVPCVDGIRVRLDNCSLTGTDMADFVQSMGNRPDVVTLILHSISGLGGVAYIWAQHLQSLTQITSMEISNCSLEGLDIEHIVDSVSRMPMVKNINLEGNTSLSGTAKVWSHRLRYLRHVSLLRLGNCSLTEDDQRFVTEASSTPYVIFSSLDFELETDSGSGSDSEAEYWKWYESAFA